MTSLKKVFLVQVNPLSPSPSSPILYSFVGTSCPSTFRGLGVLVVTVFDDETHVEDTETGRGGVVGGADAISNWCKTEGLVERAE